MPLVIITRNSKKVGNQKLLGLVKSLPYCVARHLHIESVKEAHLAPDDIEVKLWERSRFDTFHHDIEVTIFASHFPEREANLLRASREISAFIDGYLNGLAGGERPRTSGFVWIRLAPSGFSEWR